jgi:DNA-binding MarR family transcriptional regulator
MTSRSNIAVLAEIVHVVPLLFHRLRAIGDDLHAEHGITTPMRGVMHSLFDGGPQTVPQMAAARPVSRQHIQTQVDALAARGLVATVPNPAHKRSSHIALTDAGREAFESMRKKEIETLSSLLGGLSGAGLKTTQQTLVRLADKLAVLANQAKETDDDE